MATTLPEFVEAIQALSIKGVKDFLAAPPAGVTTAQLPALWIHEAGVLEAPLGKAGISWPVLSATLFLPVAPVSQSGRSTWAEAAQLAETLKAALRAATLGIGQPTVRADVKVLSLNEKTYWGVVGTVEVQG